MPYAPIDEHFDEHPKFEELELEHFGLMACAITYCNRNLTDGRLSTTAVRRFGRSSRGPKLARKLVEMGIWREVEGGWEVVGYLDHNPSRACVLAKREETRRRKEQYRTKGRPHEKDNAAPMCVPRNIEQITPTVPLGQTMGQTTGQAMGQAMGQTMGQTTGQTMGQTASRARAPAGVIHSTDTDTDTDTDRSDPPLPPEVANGSRAGAVADPARRPPAPTPTAPTTLPQERVSDARRAPVAPLGSSACQEGCEAFVQALADSGVKRAPLRAPFERQAICDALNTHLDRDGKIRTAIAELENAVREWVKSTPADEVRFTSGWSPQKFGQWLATRSSGSRRPSRPTPVKAHRALDEGYQLPPMPPPEERASPEAIRQMIAQVRRAAAAADPTPAAGTPNAAPVRPAEVGISPGTGPGSSGDRSARPGAIVADGEIGSAGPVSGSDGGGS